MSSGVFPCLRGATDNAMTDSPHPALLPTGMHDLLPPEAEIEAQVVAQLMRTLAAHGYERVGAAGPAADVEAIALAAEALAEIGVPELSVDITLPKLVPAVAEAYGIAGARAAALRAALDHKDVAAVAAVAGEAGALFR